MTNHSIPAPEDLTICFAHVAYQLEMIFARRQTDLQNFRSGLRRTWPGGCRRRMCW